MPEVVTQRSNHAQIVQYGSGSMQVVSSSSGGTSGQTAATTSTALTDTPAVLGAPGETLIVNAAGDRLVYGNPVAGNPTFKILPDTAGSIEPNHVAAGNAAGDTVVFADQISGGTF